MLGGALQAAGRGGEALDVLTAWTEASPDRVDAGSIRGLLGLLFVHSQAGDLAQVESVARATLELSERHRLRLTAGWAHRFLGDARYERDDLGGAIEHYAAVARDPEYFHLTGLREAFFGLALSYLASGRPDDAWRALRRGREIILEAGAIEHLPTVAAHEAYLCLHSGELAGAMTWAEANEPDVDSASLHVMLHPTWIRAAILCAAGDRARLDAAASSLIEFHERASHAHFHAALVRIEALMAIVHCKQGNSGAAEAALGRSATIGTARGFRRTYLDLERWFAPELRALAASADIPVGVRAAILPQEPNEPVAVMRQLDALGRLTDREREILDALTQRLTYKEIADSLYISPLTVKRHASSIYSKLGVSGRFEAIRVTRPIVLASPRNQQR